MPWRNDKYYYTTKSLETIAHNYFQEYESKNREENQSIAEGRADFDWALRLLGRGDWNGEIYKFRDYRGYGRLQQIIIADLIGVPDYELEGLGFYDILQFRGFAYYTMKMILNGEDNDSENHP